MKDTQVLQDIDYQIHNLVDFVASGDITQGVAKRKITELKKKKKTLQKKLQELDFEQSMLARKASVIEKLENTRLWWASYAERLQDEDKRALVEEVRVYPFKQYYEDHPNPEDSRTPAVVHVEIMGHIPLMENNFFGLSEVGNHLASRKTEIIKLRTPTHSAAPRAGSKQTQFSQTPI